MTAATEMQEHYRQSARNSIKNANGLEAEGIMLDAIAALRASAAEKFGMGGDRVIAIDLPMERYPRGHVISLTSSEDVGMDDLYLNALRMRPDHIICANEHTQDSEMEAI